VTLDVLSEVSVTSGLEASDVKENFSMTLLAVGIDNNNSVLMLPRSSRIQRADSARVSAPRDKASTVASIYSTEPIADATTNMRLRATERSSPAALISSSLAYWKTDSIVDLIRGEEVGPSGRMEFGPSPLRIAISELDKFTASSGKFFPTVFAMVKHIDAFIEASTALGSSRAGLTDAVPT
jgi:hypothetical protein